MATLLPLMLILAGLEASDLTKQLLEENQTETLAQVFTEKRYTGKNNKMFSMSLLEVVKKQGFWNHE